MQQAQNRTMAHMILYLCYLVLILAAPQSAHAVEYTIINTAATSPGGIRLNNEIGDDYIKQTLNASTSFIWQVFQQNTAAERKNVSSVSLFIETMDGVSYAKNNEIHFSATYIAGHSGDVKRDFTGILYHEMTHVWQWNGNGQTPEGLFEGIGDFVRLKAGYERSDWVQPRQGDRWYQGYDVTARFLDYCNSLRNGFVAELNKKMRNGYSPNYFFELLGKPVDQLWSDYKANKGIVGTLTLECILTN